MIIYYDSPGCSRLWPLSEVSHCSHEPEAYIKQIFLHIFRISSFFSEDLIWFDFWLLKTDYWLTSLLSHVLLWNFYWTYSCEDANSKLVDAVTVADDDGVGNNLLQIWNLRFRQKAKLLFRLWAQGLVKIWSWSSGKIWCWSLVSFLLLMFCKGNVESKLNLGRDCELWFWT